MPTASEFLDAGKDCGREAEQKKGERSSFSWTCSRLSQYLREKGGFGDLTLGLSFNAEATYGKREATGLQAPMLEIEEKQQGADEADGSWLKLFPQHAGFVGAFPIDKTPNHNSAGMVPKEGGGGNAKMTIFYAGKMMVFEDVPAEKAEAIMQYMGGGTTMKLPPASTTTTTTNASYLPLARKASLQRFLEMRKERLSSKAPYKTSNSTPAASKNEEKSTAGLPQSPFPVSIGLAPEVSPSTKSWLGSEPNSKGFKPDHESPVSPLDSSNQTIS